MDWPNIPWGEMQWGSVGEWVSGMGALAAVGAALWIQHREHERQDKLIEDERKHQRKQALDERYHQRQMEGRRMVHQLRRELRIDHRRIDDLMELSLIASGLTEPVYVGEVNVSARGHGELASLEVGETYEPSADRRVFHTYEAPADLTASGTWTQVDIVVYDLEWSYINGTIYAQGTF